MSGNTSWTKDVENGEFKRKARSFRHWIKADGSTPFKPEPNRYHLYVSWACPWAHRTLIVRQLKGLEDVVSFDVVDYFLDRNVGWTLQKKDPDATLDTVNGLPGLKQIYEKAQPDYSGSYTVPVLWDKKTSTIVNNESSEIIRMFNSEFNEFAKNKELDLYPEAFRKQIDETNEWVYDCINDGVYKCGFARTQEAYEKNFHKLFDALDRVENILSKSRYICGNVFTEADVRLWTTILRFDPVYYGHFKTNLRRIVDYPNIYGWLREIYQMPQVKSTVVFNHIKRHYYQSHDSINPTGIVPVGPLLNLDSPHGRDKF